MTLSNQDVVDAIFKKMDCLDLSEKNWIRKLNCQSDIDAANRQLWECLVAFYLEDLGYQPKRFSQTKTNLDFGFSINEKSFYGECVCPADGSNPDAFKPWTEVEYKNLSNGVSLAMREVTVEAAANQAGLRITSVFYESKDKNGKVKSGKQSQATRFQNSNKVAPTIVFLNTGLMEGKGIALSKIDSRHEIANLSSAVSAVYGVDGVPTMAYSKETGRMIGAAAKQSGELRRLSGSNVNRMGFRDSSLNALSAVMNFSEHPLSTCREYLFGKSIRDIFNERAELIVNASGAGDVALDDIKIFPDEVRRIFLHRDGIVLEQAGEQQCFRVVNPTLRAAPIEASQTTLRQAQGERALQGGRE